MARKAMEPVNKEAPKTYILSSMHYLKDLLLWKNWNAPKNKHRETELKSQKRQADFWVASIWNSLSWFFSVEEKFCWFFHCHLKKIKEHLWPSLWFSLVETLTLVQCLEPITHSVGQQLHCPVQIFNDDCLLFVGLLQSICGVLVLSNDLSLFSIQLWVLIHLHHKGSESAAVGRSQHRNPECDDTQSCPLPHGEFSQRSAVLKSMWQSHSLG